MKILRGNNIDSHNITEKFGLAFWFIVPILLQLIIYRPFELPIQHDRAYLLYMSQTVFRGENLYTETPYGYTPLSALVGGYLMKVGALFSLNTITVARLVGILTYGAICSAFYLLCKALFKDSKYAAIGCIMFTGLDYIAIIAGINSEPKWWVLLFSILALFFILRDKWLLVGICFAIATMCWQVVAVSLVACALHILLVERQVRKFLQLSVGTALGCIPVFCYLLVTGQLADFWYQAVVRKIINEGDVVGESIFRWFAMGVYPSLLTEIWVFPLAALGFCLLAYNLLKKKGENSSIGSKNFTFFLIAYVLLWSVFNALEFQSSADMFPLLIVFILFATYFVQLIAKRVTRIPHLALLVTVIFLSYWNIPLYVNYYTYQDQLKNFTDLDRKYGNALSIGTADYYVVMEKKAPTKYLNFTLYEENFIDRTHDCSSVMAEIDKNEISYIIERKDYYFTRHTIFGKRKPFDQLHGERTRCFNHILEALNVRQDLMHFEDKIATTYLGDRYYFSNRFYVHAIE